MSRINLLPWRAELLEERKRKFFLSLGSSLGIALVVVGLIHGVIALNISHQQTHNRSLQNEIMRLDVTIKDIKDIQNQKKKLTEQINVIQGLQANRNQIVHLFADLAKIIPNGVYLNSVKREGLNVTVTGKADSNTAISNFMRRIEASQWLANPILSEIKVDQAQVPYIAEFTLQLEQKASPLATSGSDEH